MADNSPIGMVWNGLLWVPADSKKSPAKSGRYKPTGVKSKIGLSKADPLGKFLPNIAKDISSIKSSLFSLVKMQDQEKKAAAFEKTKERALSYAKRYFKTKPTRQDKNAFEPNKKGFLETIKDGLTNIFKFALLGLGAIGASKLLSLPGVMDGITGFVKKVIVGIADLIEKGTKFLTDLLKDTEVINSIAGVLKTILKVIADGLSVASDFMKTILGDSENQKSISKVISSIIGVIFNALLASLTIIGNVLSDNKDSIVAGVVKLFTIIANGIAGSLKLLGDLISDPDFKEAIQQIYFALKDFLTTILNEPIAELGGVKVNLKMALVGLAGVMVGFELAMAGFTAWLISKFVTGGLNLPTKGGKAGKAKGAADAAGKTPAMGGWTTPSAEVTEYIGGTTEKVGGAPSKGGGLVSKAKGMAKGVGGFVANNAGNIAMGAVALGGAAVGAKEGVDAYKMANDPETQRRAKEEKELRDARNLSPTRGTEGPASEKQRIAATTVAKSFSGKSAAEFIGSMEGFAKKAYLDPPGNNKNQYSVGYGHLIQPHEVKQGFITVGDGKKITVKGPGGADTTVTEAEAKALLNSDLPKYENAVIKSIGSDAWEKLASDQKNALTSLAYNGGKGQIDYLVRFGLRDAIMKGDKEAAAKIIYEKGWKTSGGKYLAGLETRRLKEASLFGGATSGEQLAKAPTPAPTPAATEAEQKQSFGVAPAPSVGPTPASDRKTEILKRAQTAGQKATQLAQETLAAGIEKGGDFLKSLDEMTGGKLGIASGELASALRTRGLFDMAPDVVDGSRNVSYADRVQSNEPIPGVYDQTLLTKLGLA